MIGTKEGKIMICRQNKDTMAMGTNVDAAQVGRDSDDRSPNNTPKKPDGSGYIGETVVRINKGHWDATSQQ